MTRSLSGPLLAACALLFCDVAAASNRPFDGIWDTVLSCPNSNGALGYVFDFPSTVKDGTLHGEKGTKGQAGWFALDGRIGEDGSASFQATGLVGAAPFAVAQRPAGTEYGYNVRAKFTAEAGEGARVEGRPCSVKFTRRS